MRLWTPELGSLSRGAGQGELTNQGFGEFSLPSKAIVPASTLAAVVQTHPFTETAVGGSYSFTNVTTTAGNAIMVATGIRASFGVTGIVDSAGNTYARLLNGFNGGTASLDIWTTTNPSPVALVAGTITVTILSSILIVGRFWELSGIHNAAPLDQRALASTNVATASPNSGATPALTAVKQLTFGVTVNDFGTTGRTYSAQTFTSGVPSTSWTTATTGDNSSPGSGIGMHSGVIQENATTAETYSETLSTASEWTTACFSLLNA